MNGKRTICNQAPGDQIIVTDYRGELQPAFIVSTVQRGDNVNYDVLLGGKLFTHLTIHDVYKSYRPQDSNDEMILQTVAGTFKTIGLLIGSRFTEDLKIWKEMKNE